MAEDNVYLNIVINGNVPNYNPTNSNPPSIVLPPTGEGGTPAEYKVVRTSPIIEDPSKYYCSVVRFVVPLQLLPLFIMPIIPNQSNPNLTPLIFGMEVGSPISLLPAVLSQRLLYVADNNETAPLQNQQTQVITPYYYVYTYTKMITLFNDTLNSLWTQVIPGLIAPNNTLAALYPNTDKPFFFYDSNTQLVKLVVPHIFVPSSGSPDSGSVKLFINNACLQYLESFPFFFYGYNQPSGRDFDFVFENTANFYYPTPGIVNNTPPPISKYFTYGQEYNTLYYWTSVRSLVFTSQTLPILNEIVPGTNNSGDYTSFPILTDFIISSDTAGQSRSIAVYNPTAQYRLISLSGNYPINSVDIKIYWKDQLGNLYPLYLQQNTQASIKIGFFKKTMYNTRV